MVCATIYAKIRINNLNWQHIKKKELLGPLLCLCLIDDIFFDNLIVITVNPVQTKPFPFLVAVRTGPVHRLVFAIRTGF